MSRNTFLMCKDNEDKVVDKNWIKKNPMIRHHCQPVDYKKWMGWWWLCEPGMDLSFHDVGFIDKLPIILTKLYKAWTAWKQQVCQSIVGN